jgi:hypothetical protein
MHDFTSEEYTAFLLTSGFPEFLSHNVNKKSITPILTLGDDFYSDAFL